MIKKKQNKISSSTPSSARYKTNHKNSKNKLFMKYIQDNSINTLQQALIRDKQFSKNKELRIKMRKNKLQQTYEQNCRLFISINTQKSSYALPMVKPKGSLGIHTSSHHSKINKILPAQNSKKFSLNNVKTTKVHNQQIKIKIKDPNKCKVLFSCTPNSFALQNMNYQHRKFLQNGNKRIFTHKSPKEKSSPKNVQMKMNEQNIDRHVNAKKMGRNLQNIQVEDKNRLRMNIRQILKDRNLINRTQMCYFRQKTQVNANKYGKNMQD